MFHQYSITCLYSSYEGIQGEHVKILNYMLNIYKNKDEGIQGEQHQLWSLSINTTHPFGYLLSSLLGLVLYP